MLRYSLILLAGLATAGYAGAATWADGLFEELNKDFGSVPRGLLQSHEFRVVNNTRQVVNISSVRVSCGCTTASVKDGKSLLNPGEETAILARMDTSRFIGVRSVTIYVQFDRPQFEEVRLWVSANARNDFSVTPDTLNVGQVKRGSSQSAAVNLTFYGSREVRILTAKGESNYILPEFKEIRRDAEVTYQLSARLRPDTPVGKWFTDVWVTTNMPSLPQIRVPLTVEVESALTASPEAVAMGKLKLMGESERRVVVRGVQPFKITKIQGVDDQLQVQDSTVGTREVHVLTVKFKGDRPGNITRRIRVLTDLTGENEIDFQINAVVQDE
jgi:hypothetical protein